MLRVLVANGGEPGWVTFHLDLLMALVIER